MPLQNRSIKALPEQYTEDVKAVEVEEVGEAVEIPYSSLCEGLDLVVVDIEKLK